MCDWSVSLYLPIWFGSNVDTTTVYCPANQLWQNEDIACQGCQQRLTSKHKTSVPNERLTSQVVCFTVAESVSIFSRLSNDVLCPHTIEYGTQKKVDALAVVIHLTRKPATRLVKKSYQETRLP